MSSSHSIQTLAVLTLLLAGCSILNREGPDVTCADLNNGAKNACEDDIIATCVDGKVTFEVCDVGACSETWQTDGRFRCSQDDPVPQGSGGTGGTGASGGSGGTSGTGGSSGTGGAGTGGSGGCNPTGACVVVDSSSIAAFAVDGTNVYFSDGSSVQSVPKSGGFPTVLADGLTTTTGWHMALDSTHVYVHEGMPWSSKSILQVPIDGGSYEEIVVAGDSLGPFALGGQFLYWCGASPSYRSLWQTPKAGGAATEVAKGISSPDELVERGGFLYWADGQNISRVATSGPFPATPTSVPTGLTVSNFAVGADAIFLTSEADGLVARVSLTGGGVMELATGQASVSDLAIDDDFVYWDVKTTPGRVIRKVPVDGGSMTQVVETSSESSLRIELDDTHVYWADWGRIHRTPK